MARKSERDEDEARTKIAEREDRSFTIETRSLVEDVPRVGGRLRRIRRRWITRQSSRDLSDRNARPQKRLHPGVAPGRDCISGRALLHPFVYLFADLLLLADLLFLTDCVDSFLPSSAFYNGPGKRIYRDLSFTRVSPFSPASPLLFPSSSSSLFLSLCLSHLFSSSSLPFSVSHYLFRPAVSYIKDRGCTPCDYVENKLLIDHEEH